MRHVNIPVFIPHLGCPHTCVFCNQHSISGKIHFDLTTVDAEIKTALSSIDKADTETEIAFFGGSFTGIAREDMLYLLETAQRYIDSGDVTSIRLSTRPDYINDEILGILSCFGVRTIELGIQSLSDDVLSASERGHTAACAETACRAVLNAGFSLVGQMMVGLPCSTLASELYTAAHLCELGIHAARIYPTVVLYETELRRRTDLGLYKPLTVSEAVERSRDILEVFVTHDIPVIRIGLCSSDNLDTGGSFYAGGYHPALGELVESALFMKNIRKSFIEYNQNINADIIIYCRRGAVSKVTGQKRNNIKQIQNEFNVKSIKIIETDTISGYNIKIIPDGYNKKIYQNVL